MLAKHKVGSSTLLTRSIKKPLIFRGLFNFCWRRGRSHVFGGFHLGGTFFDLIFDKILVGRPSRVRWPSFARNMNCRQAKSQTSIDSWRSYGERGELDRRREILRTLSSAQAPAIPQYRSTATLRSKSLGELRRLEDELLAHDRLNVFVIAESEA
jgi:hypothetical protein